jgi:hypothetical protein
MRTLTFGAVMALLVGSLRLGSYQGIVPHEMTGTWTGSARIAVNWTVQRTLGVRLTITPDGLVSGVVGDAMLRHVRLERNRGSLARALNWKTDWIVIGDLDGDVIKVEGIHRASVKIPLNWVDDHFEGGVNTSGWHVGGKEHMWLAAVGLRLERVTAPEKQKGRGPARHQR